MNVQLLEEIMRAIVAYPKQFDMSDWGDPDLYGMEIRILLAGGELCGTPCCLAGHALMLSGKPVRHTKYEGIDDQAAILLRLDEWEAGQLFFTCSWPRLYKWGYGRSRIGSLRRARITAARIRMYVLTDGTDNPVLYKEKRRELKEWRLFMREVDRLEILAEVDAIDESEKWSAKVGLPL